MGNRETLLQVDIGIHYFTKIYKEQNQKLRFAESLLSYLLLLFFKLKPKPSTNPSLSSYHKKSQHMSFTGDHFLKAVC